MITRFYSAILLGILIKTILIFYLIHQSTVIIILLRLLKKRSASILRRIRILSLPPQLSNMNMLLLLMFPLPNVHYLSALSIRSSFPEIPTLLPAAHHLYSQSNCTTAALLCFDFSVLFIQNGLRPYLQTYIHRFALAAVPKYPTIFFFLCDAYLLLTFACVCHKHLEITMGLL